MIDGLIYSKPTDPQKHLSQYYIIRIIALLYPIESGVHILIGRQLEDSRFQSQYFLYFFIIKLFLYFRLDFSINEQIIIFYKQKWAVSCLLKREGAHATMYERTLEKNKRAEKRSERIQSIVYNDNSDTMGMAQTKVRSNHQLAGS